MDIFDFAEDWVCEGEPDLASFLLIHEHRMIIFGKYRTELNRPETGSNQFTFQRLEIEGIRWLPRIIPKAKANSVENFILKPCFVAEGIEIPFIIIGYTLQNF